MASPEETKTISLAEFAERATQGESVEQALTDGTAVAVRVFTPDQGALLGVQRIWSRVVKVAGAMQREADISDEDATLIYELGLACLRACIRDEGGAEIADIAVVDLFSKLPYKSALMVRCQELCGVSTEVAVPPLDAMKAIEAVTAEAKSVAEAKPNRKARRSAAKKG